MLEKKLKRIVPLDVLQSEELKDLIDMYTGGYADEDDEEDPVQPMTLSPQVLVPAGTPHSKSILRAAAAVPIAAGVAAKQGGFLPDWLSWKWILLGVFVMVLLFVLIRYWKMGRTLGFSYAFAAALPPLRLLLAPMTGNTSDNMLAEIEAFNLGIHPVQKPPKVKSPRKLPEQKPASPVPAPTVPEISKSELINQLVDEALQQQQRSAVPGSPKREDEIQLSKRKTSPAVGDSPRD